MTEGERKKLFREWEADYAARRESTAAPNVELPSPGQLAKDQQPCQPERELGEKRNGRGQ